MPPLSFVGHDLARPESRDSSQGHVAGLVPDAVRGFGTGSLAAGLR